MRTILPASLEGIEVYDVDSGLGGHFTVSVASELNDGKVEVRIWQGEFTSQGWKTHGLFDGKTFVTSRTKLTNPRGLC
ncbi:hypothetical protein [Rhizobium ruizarguesonis]|uniref:hypothetical protein n=1 Tax=Rhizobium ruizarguesonis TaxID=2081791 RepID=UPI00103151E0|nr:hypothetical protein [Rhizobium ruizarguesonis]TAU57453.1 hypothetical protein ELI46_39610 [Rhizobium ruizarguesonis]